jgi:riboflavin kinase/FMN adenylyltransferase
MGVDGVLIKPFTPEFAATCPESFLRTLAEKMHVRALVAGFNFTFGDRGRGNAEMIKSMAEELSYRAEIIEAVEEDGQTVSSTLIRSLLASGDTLGAQRLLRLRFER